MKTEKLEETQECQARGWLHALAQTETGQLEENHATPDRKTKDQRKIRAKERRLDLSYCSKSAFKVVCYNPAWGMKYGMGDEF